MREIDPPGYRIAKTCRCEQHEMHIVSELGAVRIDWIAGKHFARDFKFCVRCGEPLRIERVDEQPTAAVNP